MTGSVVAAAAPQRNAIAAIANVLAPVIAGRSDHFVIALWRANETESAPVHGGDGGGLSCWNHLVERRKLKLKAQRPKGHRRAACVARRSPNSIEDPRLGRAKLVIAMSFNF